MGGLRLNSRRKRREPTKAEILEVIEDLRLSKKRVDFCYQFLIDYNAENASIRAGISEKYGYKLLKDETCIQFIKFLQGQVSAYDNITPETIAGQMAVWSNSKVSDYFENDGTFKGFDNLTEDQISCIDSYQLKFNKFGQPEHKIILKDAMRANENLARPMALYQKPTDNSGDIDKMTAEELEQYIADHYVD